MAFSLSFFLAFVFSSMPIGVASSQQMDKSANVSAINSKQHSEELAAFRDALGQKVMLDFRYFCRDETPSSRCASPMTRVPQSILALLSTHNIGGVILFSENIVDAAQLVTLNYDMQKHMLSTGRAPLFIAVDQEGGRVARIPDAILPPFAGNMAIGATYHKHGSAFAKNVAEHIGHTLLPLGINTNFAPSVDVNSEPKNPVINIRSFSENPLNVGALGQAFVGALQNTGVLSAIKHFPGHGDTHVDSHSGLPRVTHSKTKALSNDVLPFANIINSNSPPAMVMSAHIQYPSLDDTTLIDKHGQQQIVPATLSKRILTDLLRTQLGYDGLVVTDALDMAGIAQFFTQEEAMVQAFSAGADIALMPFIIRNEQDISRFSQLLDSVAITLFSQKASRALQRASFARIAKTKQRFQLERFVSKPATWWIDEAKENQDTHKPQSLIRKGNQLKKALSEASISVLYGKSLLPLTSRRYLAVMPDTARCLAFENGLSAQFANNQKALSGFQFACLPMVELPSISLVKKLINDTDVLVVGDITPQHATYELGGLDSTQSVKRRAPQTQLHAFMKDVMGYAKSRGKTVVFAPLRMPYVAMSMQPYADIAIATHSYVIHKTRNAENGVVLEQEHAPATPVVTSEVLSALAKVIVGEIQGQGRSPVTLTQPN